MASVCRLFLLEQTAMPSKPVNEQPTKAPIRLPTAHFRLSKLLFSIKKSTFFPFFLSSIKPFHAISIKKTDNAIKRLTK